MFAAGDQLQQCPGIPIMGMDGRWKAHVQQAPNCPRCASTNTKFCYYNNYSLAQPRYFCKACRRYWTKGGSLRNVPVGGGCRKTRRRSRSRSNHPAPSGPHQPASSSSPEIDLAAVFARYLNQPLSQSNINSPADQLATSQGDHDLHLFDTTDLRIMDQSLDHGFMLQPDDVFWSTSTEDGSSLSAEQQELDSSSPLALYADSLLDDQFSTVSLLGDFNWSCFDQLPGYGDFCRST